MREPPWPLGTACRAHDHGLAGGLGWGPLLQNHPKDARPGRGLGRRGCSFGEGRRKGRSEGGEAKGGGGEKGASTAEAVRDDARPLLFTRSKVTGLGISSSGFWSGWTTSKLLGCRKPYSLPVPRVGIQWFLLSPFTKALTVGPRCQKQGGQAARHSQPLALGPACGSWAPDR